MLTAGFGCRCNVSATPIRMRINEALLKEFTQISKKWQNYPAKRKAIILVRFALPFLPFFLFFEAPAARLKLQGLLDQRVGNFPQLWLY